MPSWDDWNGLGARYPAEQVGFSLLGKRQGVDGILEPESSKLLIQFVQLLQTPVNISPLCASVYSMSRNV